MTISLIKKISLLAVSCATLLASNVAFSQQLEEIIVTAQKREQNLQDVTVSVTAVLGETLRANGIEKIEQLAQSMPALHISEAVGGDIIALRGLGPGNNPAFETSVGTQVDGFYYGRSRFSRLQFLDLERVEVLKGPQGAVIGKNNTAGAINITTAKPTDEFEGYVNIHHEFEGGEGELYEGAVSGTVIDDFMTARVALRYEDKDGYIFNTTTGTNDQSIDDLAGRISLLFEPSQFENFSALFQYAFAEIDRPGRHLQFRSCDTAALAFIAANGIDEDCTANTTRSATDKRTVGDSGGFEGVTTDAETLGLTLNWDLENFTLTSLTGYARYDYVDFINTSYTNNLAAFSADQTEDYEQFSQEFRITSNESVVFGGQSFDYIVGVNYLEHQLDTQVRLNIPFLAATRAVYAFQDGTTSSIFGRLDWHLNDAIDIALEARYTYEEKDGRHVQNPVAFLQGTVFGQDLIAPPAMNVAGVANVHDITDSVRESNLSPGVTVSWRPNDDWMLYGSWKKGFKSSGLDVNVNASQATALGRYKFNNEEVEAYELGAKITLLDGAARVNFTAFRNDFTDLQRATLVSTATFVVGNAADATTQGFEVDGQWALTDAFSVSGSLLLLDAEYDSFTDAGCTQDQLEVLPGGAMGAAAASCTQDLSGQPLEYAADYYFSFGAEYVWPMTNGLDLTGALLVYGEDEKFLAGDLDVNVLEDSFTKVDARLTLSSENNWDISLIARNLGDEQTSGFANDNSATSSFFSMTDPPRSLILQGGFRF